MSDFKFDKKAYLDRIKFDGIVSTDFEFLKAIRLAQHRTIPFENFDICLGKDISIKPDDIVNKLVTNKRGGYCSELNGLFLLALQEFGFQARTLLGRVHVSGEITGRGHRVTLVTIGNDNWLVDTGFGADTPTVPIRIAHNNPVTFEGKTFRLMESKLYGFMLQRKEGNDWKELYSIDLSYIYEGDLDYANYFTSTNPKSLFVRSRVAILSIENGMKILYNMQFKTIINGKEEKVALASDQSYLDTLEREFGIVLNASYQDLKPII